MWGSLLSRAADLGLTIEVCDSTGPPAKLKGVAGNACFREQISQFAQAGDQLNSLEICGPSLRSAASGIRRWAFFCDLAGGRTSLAQRRGCWRGPAFSEPADLRSSPRKGLPASRRLDDVEVEGCPDRRSRVGSGGRSVAQPKASGFHIPADPTGVDRRMAK